jgi:hypothetical protein
MVIATVCEQPRIRKQGDRWIVINQKEGKMKRRSPIIIGLLVVAFTFAGYAHLMGSSGWAMLIDGQKGLENWNRLGGANWRAEGGAIVADKSTTKGSSFLVPSYGTGAIVDVAKVPVPIVYKAGGKWNTYQITAKGPELTVVFNGVVTAQPRDSKFAEGPIALQYNAGPIKFRKVQVKPL